ncbi:MAG: LemA family protein [Bacilli bacterium]|nr:LemA family protein [Bacilli bacterium]MCI9435444.1 LemA family protein [Bacilli bacterium]
MEIFTVCLIIIVIIALLGIGFASLYNKFQTFIIRMNEAEANIDSTLRKRFDLLNKSITIIKTATKVEENIMENIENLRSQKLSNFDFDRKLYDLINEFNKYKELYPELKQNDTFVKIDIELGESEAEIVAFRKYYNDIVTDYNKLIHKFPSNIVALICRYEHKNYFDGKDMTDDDTEDFKV